MLKSLPNWPARVAAAHTISREMRAGREVRLPAGAVRRPADPGAAAARRQQPAQVQEGDRERPRRAAAEPRRRHAGSAARGDQHRARLVPVVAPSSQERGPCGLPALRAERPAERVRGALPSSLASLPTYVQRADRVLTNDSRVKRVSRPVIAGAPLAARPFA